MFGSCSFQKDVGQNDVNTNHLFSIIFYSGIGVQNMLKWGLLVALGFVIIASFMLILHMVPSYLEARFSTLTNPFGQESGTGYHISNSLMAIGNGGLFGRGLGNSIMKLGYLPEPHTDFIFISDMRRVRFSGWLISNYFRIFHCISSIPIS